MWIARPFSALWKRKSTIVDLSYHEVMAKNGKRTGRPAGMGDVNKRRLLEAAREQFSSQGFRGVTMRSIAAQAGVDVALIARHFGSKDGLFAAAVELPEEAPEILATALSAPLQEQGERLARGYLGLWEDPATSAQMLSLARASFNHEGAGARLGESIMGAEVSPRLDALVSDRRTGLSLAMTQLIGAAIARYISRIPRIVELDFDTFVTHISPAVQLHLEVSS